MTENDVLHIYTRVSTEAQEEKGTSLDTQKSLGIEAAERLKLKHKVWNEGGASSFYEDLSNRPILMQLMHLIDSGQVKHLWVFNNDRLSRNDVTAQMIRAALKKHSVILYTKDGRFDLNNAQDNLMKTFLDAIAAFENTLRADRTRLGKLNKVKAGYWMGGPPPFGYRVVDKKLALCSEESQWVQKIYGWYAEGKSIQWIKSELDKNGVRTNRGNALWSQGSINKILQNTHPLGCYTYTDSKSDERVECICPPIVSKTLWSECQEQRKKILERKGQNNRTKRFYLLRNLLYCGHCDSPMSARTKESKHEFLYYCPRKEREWKTRPLSEDSKWLRNTGCSMSRSLNIPSTDQFVWANVIVDLFKSNYLQTNIQKALEANTSGEKPEIVLKLHRSSLSRLRKEKADIIKNIAAVKTAEIIGRNDKQIADEVIKNLTNLLQETDIKIEQLEILVLQIEQRKDLYANIGQRIERSWTAELDIDSILEKQARKQLLEKLIKKILVFYDRERNEHELKIHFKIPLLESFENKKPNGGRLSLKKKPRATA